MKKLKLRLSLIVLAYFRLLARLQLKKNPRAVIIGVTGSAGKTSFRLALLQLMRTRGRVKHSSHANSESGIALNILGLQVKNYSFLDWLRLVVLAPFQLLFNQEKYDYYIVEMGIDSPHPPKNMDYLLSIIRPDIAVILNAGLVHGAAFDHLVADKNPRRRVTKIINKVAEEKMKLALALPPSGVVVLNADQQEFRQLRPLVKARVLTYGKRISANLQINRFKSGDPTILNFTYQAQKYELKLKNIFEQGYAYTFAAAISCAAALGIPPDKSIPALVPFRSPAGRLRLLPGINMSTIIDSSYNASPATMKSALELLREVAGKHPRVAILGDMRELGSQTKTAHKDLVDHILKNCDLCLLFGENMGKYTAPVLRKLKFPVFHFARMLDLTTYLSESLPLHAYVLVKGSQNTIFLERAVEAILRHQEDRALLCRRGPYWDEQRANTP